MRPLSRARERAVGLADKPKVPPDTGCEPPTAEHASSERLVLSEEEEDTLSHELPRVHLGHARPTAETHPRTHTSMARRRTNRPHARINRNTDAANPRCPRNSDRRQHSVDHSPASPLNDATRTSSLTRVTRPPYQTLTLPITLVVRVLRLQVALCHHHGCSTITPSCTCDPWSCGSHELGRA